MTFVVGPPPHAGHRVIVHERLDSTNSEALRLARAGERGPLWIVARGQTAGRGRRGRAGFRSLAISTTSLLLTENVAPVYGRDTRLRGSLAVCEPARLLAPGVAFAVKWPNDVLVDRNKVAGILLELKDAGGSPSLSASASISQARPRHDVSRNVSGRLGVDVSVENAFVGLTDRASRSKYGTAARVY